MDEWKEINTEEDIDELGSLHDSVVVSVNYNSGCYEDSGKFICWTPKEEHTASVIIDHSWSGRIELFFTGVRCCVISGFSEYYLKEIYGCGIEFRTDLLGKTRDDRLIVWTDDASKISKEIRFNIIDGDTTFIIAEKLKWRYIEKFEREMN